MRRRKAREKDEAQASLDAFTGAPKAIEAPAEVPPEPPEPSVPSMPDLDLLAEADEMLRQENEEALQAQEDPEQPLRTFDMPSMQANKVTHSPAKGPGFYDLGKKYPNPPLPSEDGGLVLHRAVLNDLTGCDVLLDWVAEGHAVIVEMKRLMKRTVEFNAALAQLNAFIVDDVGGQLLRMTESRLLLLPAGCRGVNGVEMEAFAAEPGEFSGVGI
tara:strand:+ start:10746 stop:11390 length:645 start_codon:yes stop_codon:yes gene_type:complete